MDAVGEVVTASGVAGRRLRQVIARLSEGPHHLEDLVRDCAVPRRTVEALLRAADADLLARPDGTALRDEVVAEYRNTFGYEQLRRTEPADPFAAQMAAHRQLTGYLRTAIASAPTNQALDHVSATADTAIRRALWLDATYDLAGAHLVCVGDHDLTALAVSGVQPRCRVSVVDVDEGLLRYIADRAAERGFTVDCWYGDLRFGLPPALVGSGDLVFTDPPYTPEGVELFLSRGADTLRDRVNGRLVMAYGFSPLAPALGVKVQRAVHELELAVEAILPAFNRYEGAQAVGSASDLYVCRPTSRTWQRLERRSSRTAVNIYTRGGQSLEARGEEHWPALTAVAGTMPDDDRALYAGDGWPGERAGSRLPLAELFTSGPPAGRAPADVAVNLVDDPGPWLVRALLALNADRVRVLVPNQHPDLADAASQGDLRSLLAAKYTLKLRRSTPTSRHAVVEATAVTENSAARWLLTHAHGKVSNVLREALIRGSAEPMTKNQARALVARFLPTGWSDGRLVDLPRAGIRALIDGVER
jgi:predicted methyltransferase